MPQTSEVEVDADISTVLLTDRTESIRTISIFTPKGRALSITTLTEQGFTQAAGLIPR
jgi:hypothetical protein